ncbi:MAG TPA: hypothetical protein VFG09_06395 [Thermodesulfovibrionales bacterium]|jgi:hypothetical protein|nr:hypothetical protein [Thermodesulfovibrionales bacterium]
MKGCDEQSVYATGVTRDCWVWTSGTLPATLLKAMIDVHHDIGGAKTLTVTP